MKLNWLILSSFLFSSFSLYSQEGGYEEVYQEGVFEFEQETASPFYPFSVSGSFLVVSGAPFRTSDFKDEKIHYNQATAALAYTHPLGEYCGLLFGAGYVGTKVAWADNPNFDERFFNYVNFSIGGYTKSYPDWSWSVVGNMFIDTECFSLRDYALYQGILWGRYTLCKPATLHFGFILEVGLNKGKIWPIFGFEFAPFPDIWKLSLVYPIDVSFDYFFARNWSLGGSIRFLRNRHRVKETEPLPKGIFEYRTTGAEFDLTYQPARWLMVTGFAGSTFNGDLKVTNSKNHNATHYKFKGSFYSGVEGVLSF